MEVAIHFQENAGEPCRPEFRRLRNRPPLAAASNWVLACCFGFALLTAIVPFARAFYRVEVNYNEGWNVYNAALETAHRQLYPQPVGWTTVNYPMLFYVLLARLHQWTHDYLFTARVLSLVSLCGCCVLVGSIVYRLSSAWRPALLAGFFCLALFSVAADYPAYVGMDDPQMLALVFFLAGFWVGLGTDRIRVRLALAALLFVLAGSIKHNPIEFPLAVLLDLLFLSPRRALWFAACSATFLAAAIGLQVHYGGPYFLDAMLAPRAYSFERAIEQSAEQLSPLLLPLVISLYMAYRLRHHQTRRIAGILLVLSLLMGVFFSGGSGVSINALFGSYLAMSILIGLFFWRVQQEARPYAVLAPLLLSAWLLIPWLVVPPLDNRASAQVNWNPALALQGISEKQARFDEEVAFLRSQPGPALCESLLRCYYAGKPYRYDPFNATRLIRLHKLDASELVAALRQQQYGAVQLDRPGYGDTFDPAIIAAIQAYYQPVLENQDVVIYLPNSALAAQHAATATTATAVAYAKPGSRLQSGRLPGRGLRRPLAALLMPNP